MRGDDRLIVERGVGAADGEFRNDLRPVLVALEFDAGHRLQPLRVVGAEQRAARCGPSDRQASAGCADCPSAPPALRRSSRWGSRSSRPWSGSWCSGWNRRRCRTPVQQAGNQAVEGHRLHIDLVDFQHLGGKFDDVAVEAGPFVVLRVEERIRPVVRGADDQRPSSGSSPASRRRELILISEKSAKSVDVHRRRRRRGARAEPARRQQRRRAADRTRCGSGRAGRAVDSVALRSSDRHRCLLLLVWIVTYLGSTCPRLPLRFRIDCRNCRVRGLRGLVNTSPAARPRRCCRGP